MICITKEKIQEKQYERLNIFLLQNTQQKQFTYYITKNKTKKIKTIRKKYLMNTDYKTKIHNK